MWDEIRQGCEERQKNLGDFQSWAFPQEWRQEFLSPCLLSLPGCISKFHKGLWSNSMWKFRSCRKETPLLTVKTSPHSTALGDLNVLCIDEQQFIQTSASLKGGDTDSCLLCDWQMYQATVPMKKTMMSQAIRLEHLSLSKRKTPRENGAEKWGQG